MANRHSFVVSKSGRCYNGEGNTESHTSICTLHNLVQDSVNAYEWQPPPNWPNADWEDGLTRDTLVFVEKSSHLDTIGSYLRRSFPDMEAWETWDHGPQPIATTITATYSTFSCGSSSSIDATGTWWSGS